MSIVPFSYTQVDGHVGYYDRSGSSSKLKGEFTLTADTEVMPSTKRDHAFTLRGAGMRHKRGKFTFAAPDATAKQNWITAFEAHIEFVRKKDDLDMDRVDYSFG